MVRIPNNPKTYSVDIALTGGQDYELYNNDLKMVASSESIGFALIRRILVNLGSWDADKSFGGQLWDFLKTQGANQVTEGELSKLVERATNQMIVEGKIKQIDNVRIIEKSKKGISVEISFTIGDNQESTSFVIPN